MEQRCVPRYVLKSVGVLDRVASAQHVNDECARVQRALSWLASVSPFEGRPTLHRAQLLSGIHRFALPVSDASAVGDRCALLAQPRGWRS